MNNQKGQATILIGVIFQVIFIFFAMVINVGLLVNDKINLQNSVDIAVYYAAMKQAEVLNTMGHINFQMRQAWKLLNWRLWVLGDVGRNKHYKDFISGNFQADDGPAGWVDEKANYPVVCVRNQLWNDEYIDGNQPQNFCKEIGFTIPALKPLVLGPFQSTPLFAFMQIFRAQSVRNSKMFNNDCEAAGPRNLYYATLITTSFKAAAAQRRIAMKRLQDKLILSNDMQDIAGQSIRETAEATLKRNLTLANRDAIEEIGFYNSLTNQPFLVPIELRAFISYVDIFENGNCMGEVRELNENTKSKKAQSDPFTLKILEMAHKFTGSDYGKKDGTTSAEFAQEQPQKVLQDMISTIGFEKNPWVTAYVKVSAKTRPRMLFSPMGDGRVQLVAEAYAMPFGGRLGPWYGNSWDVSEDRSNATAGKVDALLPPRIGETLGEKIDYRTFAPNYSRYPGDKLGMKSGLSRTMGLREVASADVEHKPKLAADDYGNILAEMEEGTLKQDPLVYRINGTSKLRDAEILAVAPDLFDAAYFSVTDGFANDMNKKTLGQFFQGLCANGCDDMGTPIKGPNAGKSLVTTKDQIDRSRADTTTYWKISDPLHLNTGWGQRSADNYDGPNEVIGEKIGRAGYSVKIVSESYLRAPQTLGGAAAGPATIKNPPR